MPIVNIAGVGQVKFPDNMSHEAITRAIETEILPQRKKPEQAGFWSSFKNTAATLGDAPEAARFVGAAGTPEEAAKREELIKAQTPEYGTTGFHDINSVGSAIDFIRQTAGSSAGALAAPGAAAFAAGLMKAPGLAKVAGAGLMGAQYLTTNLSRQAGEQKEAIDKNEAYQETSLGKATLASAGQTALDVLGLRFFKPVFGSFPVVGKLFGREGEEAAQSTAQKIVEAGVNKSITYRNGIAKGIAKGVAFEMPQEIAQQALERWQAGLSLTDKDAQREYVEAAAGAVVLGGGLGGMGGFMNTVNKKAEANAFLAANNPPETETPETAEAIAAAAAKAQTEDQKNAVTTIAKLTEDGFLSEGYLENALNEGKRRDTIVEELWGNKDLVDPLTKAGLNKAGLKKLIEDYYVSQGLDSKKRGEIIRAAKSANAKKVAGTTTSADVDAEKAALQAEIGGGNAAFTPAEFTIDQQLNSDGTPTGTENNISSETGATGEKLVNAANAGVDNAGSNTGPITAGTSINNNALIQEPNAVNLTAAQIAAAQAASGYSFSSSDPSRIALNNELTLTSAQIAAAQATVTRETQAAEAEAAAQVAEEKRIEEEKRIADEVAAAKPATEVALKPITKKQRAFFVDQYNNASSPELKEKVANLYNKYLTGKNQSGETLAVSTEGAEGLSIEDEMAALKAEITLDSLFDKIVTPKDLRRIRELGNVLLQNTPEAITAVTKELAALKRNYADTDAQEQYKGMAKNLRDIIEGLNKVKAESPAAPAKYGVYPAALNLETAAELLDTAQSLDDQLKAEGVPGSSKRHGEIREGIAKKLEVLKEEYSSLTEAPLDVAIQRKANEAKLKETEAIAYDRAQRDIAKRGTEVTNPTIELLKKEDIRGTLENIATRTYGWTTKEYGSKTESSKLVKAINSILEAADAGDTNYATRLTRDLGLNKKDKTVSTEAFKIIANFKEAGIINKEGKVDKLAAVKALDAAKEIANEELRANPIQSAVFKKLAEELLPIFAFDGVTFKSKVYIEGQKAAIDTPLSVLRKFEELRKNNNLAGYIPKYDTFYFTKEGLTDATILHEITHAATVKVIRQYYVDKSKLKDSQREAVEHIIKVMEVAKKSLGGKYRNAFANTYEFVSYALTDSSFQGALAGIQSKELVKYTDSLSSDLWSNFTAAIARLYDLVVDKMEVLARKVYRGYEGNAALEVSEAVKFILASPSGGVDIKGTLPAARQATVKVAKVYVNKSFDDKTKELEESLREKNPATSVARVVREIFTSPEDSYTKIKRLLQNDRIALKNLEDLFRATGKLIVGRKNFNNLYSLVMLSSGNAHRAMTEYMQAPMEDLRDAIDGYAKSKGISTDAALARLHVLTMAQHEKERRHIQFLKLVPLNPVAANERIEIFKKLGIDKKLTASEIAGLRQALETLVENNRDGSPTGFSGITATADTGIRGPRVLDEANEAYHVVSDVTSEEFERYRKEYDVELKDPIFRKIVEPKTGLLAKVQKQTIELNEQSNYHSKQVDNYVRFYDYQNYVPFKGKPDSDPDAGVSTAGKPRRSIDFAEGVFTTQGRQTDSDNPILQTMIDGTKAAIRAGRKDVTQAVVNISKNKLADIKLVARIHFNERDSFDYKKEGVSGPDNVFHYADNGDIEVYRVINRQLSEALRRSYREANPLLEAANFATSKMGQFHTRYNPSFAPMNFVRDMLTNSFTMLADFGPAEAARYVGEMARQVVTFGIGRAFTVAKLYSEGNYPKLRELAKTDEFVKDMLEYIDVGGRVSYVQGLAVQGQLQELNKSVGRSKLIRTTEQFNKWVDVWSDMFELTSRTAAYRVGRDNAKSRDPKGNARAWQIEGASYAKNLANFEQVGEWGREMGAAFMFFRPAATGAVRALDSLIPAFQDVERLVRRLPPKILADEAAVKEFRKNHAKAKQGAQTATLGLLGAGATIYLMALLLSGDDDEGRNMVATDDMARWTRYLRLPMNLGGANDFVQIPWGYGFGAFAATGAQIAAISTGNAKMTDGFGNIMQIGADSFLPLPFSKMSMTDNFLAWAIDSTLPSLARPFVEFVMNKDSLGRSIYNNRQTRVGDAYTGGDNVPELYKFAAKAMFNATNGAVDIGPNTMYFFANNYADGISRVTHNGLNLGLTLGGSKDFDPKTDLLFLDSFFGKKSNYDAREYAAIETQIEDKRKILKTLEVDPAGYARRVEAYPMDPAIVSLYDQYNGSALRDLRAMANTIRASRELSIKDKSEMLKDVVRSQNLVKRNVIDMMKYYNITP